MTIFLGHSNAEWFFDEDRRIGDSSGMGLVFEGSHVQSGRRVAIKRVRLRFGGTGERRRRDREVEIGRLLMSAGGSDAAVEHLLLPLDYAYVDDDLFIVMPLAQGSLGSKLGDKLSTADKIKTLRDVAYGLMELANLGILHRDLKPANILLVDDVWKLADFGISRNLEESTGTYTFLGAGTIPYMAPELWKGQAATVKSDLYAFGVLAYEVLEGHRPFNGPGENEYRQQHLNKAPPTLVAAIHPTVVRLVQRLLRKDPVERPQDARAVLEAFDDYLKILNPDQENLLKAMQVREHRRAHAEARQSAADASKEARLALRRQGIIDLDEILQDVAGSAKAALPDLELTTAMSDNNDDKFLRERGWCLNLTFVRTYFHIWRDQTNMELPPIVGDVWFELPGKPSGYLNVFLIANIVYEQRRGRYGWFIARFGSRGRARAPFFEEYGLGTGVETEPLTISSAMSLLSAVISASE